MSVVLRVSEELLDHMGAGEFESHLGLFDATVLERVDADRYGSDPFSVAYRLDVPSAPPGAVEAVPVFQNVGENGNVSVRLHELQWLDAHRRKVEPMEAPDA